MEKRKLKILTEILGSYRKVGEEYLFFCPFCKHHKAKLSVNLNRGVKCWICNWSSPRLYRLVKRLGTGQQKEEWRSFEGFTEVTDFTDDLFGEKEAAAKERIFLPEEFVSLANKKTPITAAGAKSYLRKRGVSKQDIKHWKIGYCFSGSYEGRIVVPSFDTDGEVSYFIARSYNNAWPRYKNPPVDRDIIFNELMIDWDNDVNIVEGVFDAIVAGPNSIPLLGSTLREKSQILRKIVENDVAVYIALDEDAEKKALKMIQNLLQYNVELYKIPTDGYEDVGEMTREEFLLRKGQAVRIDLDTILWHEAAAI